MASEGEESMSWSNLPPHAETEMHDPTDESGGAFRPFSPDSLSASVMEDNQAAYPGEGEDEQEEPDLDADDDSKGDGKVEPSPRHQPAAEVSVVLERGWKACDGLESRQFWWASAWMGHLSHPWWLVSYLPSTSPHISFSTNKYSIRFKKRSSNP